MRITFYTSDVETLEYFRVVNSILKSNKEVDDNVKAFDALKELVESIDDRLNKIESERRNKVCR